ncbi:MAG: energy transducer TonB [Muribaculaceae bacterium]|nr:energy transducer TonB [Muribaculaceae bacterium]MBR6489677.1 energy transducer TonB [Muribaculaceae bacterium]
MTFTRLTSTLLLALLGVLAFNASAQSAQLRDVTTCNPMSPSKSGYNMVVYEYESVDIRPQFPGGERSMINFINETREYPYNAYHNHIQGRVICSFIVGTDGRLFNIQVIRGSGDETLDREAMRVISKMPKWTVGKIENTKVNVRCVLPIAFRL